MGYQNSQGFSGSDVDKILEDHRWKTSSQEINLNINAWNGTPEAGIYPEAAEGQTIIGFNVTEEPASGFSFEGRTYKFGFINNQTIIAQVISQNDYVVSDDARRCLGLFFIAKDGNSKNQFYIMEITYAPGKTNIDAKYKIRAISGGTLDN